jgi:HlyD family secretion protein
MQESRALPEGIVGVNGRVEATQAQIATKNAGRIIESVPREGDMVAAGSIFASSGQVRVRGAVASRQGEAARYRRSLARAQADIQARKAELKFAEQQFSSFFVRR